MGTTVRPLARTELDTVLDWAAVEGWNPGLHDAAAFHAADPHGFFGLFVDGEIVATLSVVRYDASFAFLGCYICRPDLRGKGFGLTLWETALDGVDVATVGLDGVFEQQDNYRRDGFLTAHRSVRFGGEPSVPEVDDPRLRRLAVGDVDLVGGFEHEARVFPSPRVAFLERWLDAPGSVGYGIADADGLRGYGVIRPCREGSKIGPLFASTRADAEVLLGRLVVGAPRPVFLDVPDPNRDGVALADDAGLVPRFETARMYRGPDPGLALDQVFGITSFELG